MNETKLKFYRVKNLPSHGEIGGIYFVYGGDVPRQYICVSEGNFEPYTHILVEGDNIKIEDGVISAEVPEGVLTESNMNDKLKAYQTKSDIDLTTQDKTVVGAINELKSTIDITIPLLQAGL